MAPNATWRARPAYQPELFGACTVTGAYDTGMDLLTESALSSTGWPAPVRARKRRCLSALADRINSYLAKSRPTTTLGMPQIVSDERGLTDADVIHRTGEFNKSHIRVLSD